MLTTMYNFLYDIWQEPTFYYCQPYKRIYKFPMELIPHDWKHLIKTETFQMKNPLRRHYTYPKALGR